MDHLTDYRELSFRQAYLFILKIVQYPYTGSWGDSSVHVYDRHLQSLPLGEPRRGFLPTIYDEHMERVSLGET